jgi:hypothetical protein
MMSILAANPVSAVTEFNAQLQILELLDNVSITCLLNNTFGKLDPLLMFTYGLCSSSEPQFAVIHGFIFLLDFFLRIIFGCMGMQIYMIASQYMQKLILLKFIL